MFARVLLTFLILSSLFTLLPSLASVAVAGITEKEAVAVSSAQIWLGLMDKGKYAESWDEAADLFKNAMKQKQWEQTSQAVRTPLGKVLSRKLKAKSYRTSLPGAPDGEYVVVQFETSFEHKKFAVETITPMLDKHGKWRVAGYYIK